MKVLLTVASLKPSYGGPAFSVSQLANALVEEGISVGVWTPDSSAMGSELLGPGVMGLGGTAEDALSKFGRPDIFHDNGIWLAHNHRLAALGRRMSTPRIVSTRGMLEPWARRHKAWKKNVAWLAYQRRDLATAAVLHATAQAEADNLAAIGLKSDVAVIANGIPAPASVERAWEPAGDRTALFLGRIYPVKGLPMLIEAWAQVRPQGWRLRIAGPDEAGHRSVVESAVARHGLEKVVEFSGAIPAASKAEVFAGAQLFVLPSHSESFGMAVGEALAHGLPVLTTKAAPWPSLETDFCGWWVEPTAAGLADGLRQATQQPLQVLSTMGDNGRALIAREFSWPAAAARFVELYQRLTAANSARP